MQPYKEEFPVGTRVQIAASSQLHDFRRTWSYHHPLEPEQLDFAGHRTTVAAVSFYHGGDVLYTLHHAPGIWHECCLHPPDAAARNTSPSDGADHERSV